MVLMNKCDLSSERKVDSNDVSKFEKETSERRFAKDLLVNYSAINDRKNAIIEYRNYSFNNAKFFFRISAFFSNLVKTLILYIWTQFCS